VNCVSNGLPVGKPLAAALEYAARGWHVFPCRPRSKAPAIENGFYRATTNPETIKEYWSNSDRNIGIRTGVASGFWVLDVDDDDGGEASLNALQAKHDRLPITREVTTGDGRHLYFDTRRRSGRLLRSRLVSIREPTAATCWRRRLFIRMDRSTLGRITQSWPSRPTGS
jgi:Bifunctional DNA primase/polymerase, N-terminal